LSNSKDTLKDSLPRYRQIKISVIGRKSGKTISNPVWFVVEGDTLYLLPVHGSDTQWHKNVLKNPSIRIDARGAEAEFRAARVTEAKAVKFVVEKFREKYGAGDVKKSYSKFDAAVLVELTEHLKSQLRSGVSSSIGSTRRSRHLLFSSFPQRQYQHRGCEQRNARKDKPAVETSSPLAHCSHRIRPHKAAKVPDGVDQSNPRRR
jgi:deazaflavin-dependent oxidoreductase (nitroreductase family)